MLTAVAERDEQRHRKGTERAGALGILGHVHLDDGDTALVFGADRLQDGREGPAVRSAGGGDEGHHRPRPTEGDQAFFVRKPSSGYAGQ